MRERKSYAYFLILLGALAGPPADARNCSNNINIPSDMTSAIENLVPYWEDVGGFGMKNLFQDTSVCGQCHSPHATRQVYAPTATAAYSPCSNCHTRDGSNNQSYPGWLRFDRLPGYGGEPAQNTFTLKSYYSPGKTKAEAIALRAIDGTMPPGSNQANDPNIYNGRLTRRGDNTPVIPVGWCSEISSVYNAWVAAGFP